MSEPTTLEAGSVVGDKYVIERPLGEGGMGTVYLAHHRTTGRRVALKWVPLADQVARQRVLREARSMARLAHPNVAGVLDLGEEGGAAYLIIDYYEGHNLRTHAELHGPLTPAAAIDLLLPALSGVAAAHQAGVLHRDLKPENLFVCIDADGSAYDTKVLDFGVAKQLEASDRTALTTEGAIVGTPRYMAPEQISSEWEPDERADVFAMGLVLYELVVGRTPYRSTSLKKLVIEILKGGIPPAHTLEPGVPEGLSAVLERATANARTDRYEDIAAFARALEPWAGERSFLPPRAVHTPNARDRIDNMTVSGFADPDNPPVNTRRGQAALEPTLPASGDRTVGGEVETVVERAGERGWRAAAAHASIERGLNTAPVGTTDSEEPRLPAGGAQPARPAASPSGRTPWLLAVAAALVFGGIALALWGGPRVEPAPAPVMAQPTAAPPGQQQPQPIQPTVAAATRDTPAEPPAPAAAGKPEPHADAAAVPTDTPMAKPEHRARKKTARRRKRDDGAPPATRDDSAVEGRSGVFRAEDF